MSMKDVGYNFCLVGLGCLIACCLVEGVLRISEPKYEALVAPAVQSDDTLLWKTQPNTLFYFRHPDHNIRIENYFNNLGLRQHRIISIEEIESSSSVAFFGDSYAANTRMSAPFSFTEPLDFLLKKVNKKSVVLNFGVNGYGPDQEYLYYKKLPYKDHLDDVYYVFSNNDLKNISRNKSITGRYSQFHFQEKKRRPWYSYFYMTYFIKEKISILLSKSPLIRKERSLSEYREEVEGVFFDILRQWKTDVEKNGGRFSVIMLPDNQEVSHKIAKKIYEKGYNLIDLDKRFCSTVQQGRVEWRFENDGHWNEYGNYLAVLELFQNIDPRISKSRLSEEDINAYLSTYYGSFEDMMSLKMKQLLPLGRLTSKISTYYNNIPEHLKRTKAESSLTTLMEKEIPKPMGNYKNNFIWGINTHFGDSISKRFGIQISDTPDFETLTMEHYFYSNDMAAKDKDRYMWHLYMDKVKKKFRSDLQNKYDKLFFLVMSHYTGSNSETGVRQKLYKGIKDLLYEMRHKEVTVGDAFDSFPHTHQLKTLFFDILEFNLEEALAYFEISKEELELDTYYHTLDIPQITEKALFWRVCTVIEQDNDHKIISEWSEPCVVIK